ncbi:MAG: M48 family metallopeptidase [Helicobacteraceae bacterium]|nr:M48 family metallopeptidase [Helicobacteraceae bacterium]
MGFVWILVAFYATYIAVDLAITIAQIGYVKRTRGEKAALLSDEDWLKAADYQIESLRLGIVGRIYSLFCLALWVFWGFNQLDALINDSGFKAALFISFYLIINSILHLPFRYYETFRIDQKFGFNRSTRKLFFTDFVKQLAIVFIIAFLITFAIPDNFSFQGYWWLYAFTFSMLFIVAVNLLFPLFAKLFNRFEPIDDTPLGEKIKMLLGQAGFSAKGVFKIDAAKRDARLNAYFAGLGKTKRVALYDTLIEKLSEREILAVLGHELGHFKHKDIFKRIGAIGIVLFSAFAFLGVIDEYFYLVFEALNLPQKIYILFAFLLIVIEPIVFFARPFINAFSRRAEFAADAYGAKLTDKADLKSALIKLVIENRSYPRKYPIYALWNESHPNILTRIERLGIDG